MLRAPGEGGAEVVGVALEAREPGTSLGCPLVLVGTACELEEPVGVPAEQRRLLSSSGELFERVLARQFEKKESAVTVAPQQALLDQGLKIVETRATNGLCGLKFETPREHPELTEHRLLFFGEQLIAPADRGAHRGLPVGGIAPAPAEQVESLHETAQHLAGAHQLHPRGRELERERQAIKPFANLSHRLVGLKVRLELTGPGNEEFLRCRFVQRWHWVFLLERDREALATGHDHAQLRK